MRPKKKPHDDIWKGWRTILAESLSGYKKNYLSDFLTWESRKRSIPTPHFASLGHVMTRHFNIVLLRHKGHSFTVLKISHFTKNFFKFSDLLIFYEEVTHCPSDAWSRAEEEWLLWRRDDVAKWRIGEVTCPSDAVWRSEAYPDERDGIL